MREAKAEWEYDGSQDEAFLIGSHPVLWVPSECGSAVARSAS